MEQIIRKIVAVMSVLLIILSYMQNAFAVSLNDSVRLYIKGECDYTLQANDGKGFYPLTCTYVEYMDENGERYPAYCVNRGLEGIGEYDSYDVSLSNLIQDDRLWRIAVNGYPNKTASELGVENELDAFFATKQAVYSIIGNFNIDEHYKPVNERGEKILNAIRMMVNEGREGTKTYKKPTVNINIKGNLKEETIDDVKYLVQYYNVTSEFEIRSYKIRLENSPKDTKVIKSGETFKIAIPYTSLINDVDFNIYIEDVEAKSYPVFYGETLIAGTQNYMIIAHEFEFTNTATNLQFKTNNSSIEILKKDEDTGEAIQGTEFALYNSKGEKIQLAKTDDMGIVRFIDLYQGEYKIKEIKASKDYKSNDEEIPVTVHYGEEKIVDITNKKETGKIKIIKVDKDNIKIGIPNVIFEILDEDDNIIQVLTTNKEGIAESIDLKVDKTYRVIEKSTLQEYILSKQDEVVKLEANEIKTLKFENEKKKGQIEIIKTDSEDDNIKIENAEFEIINSEGDVLEVIKTDKNGYAISSKIPVGKYKIREIKTDDMHVIDESIVDIEIEDNSILTLRIVNERKPVIKLPKTGM